jgi:hypothetical protein
MKQKKVLIRLKITFAIIVILFACLYITYKLFFNPYRGTVQTTTTSADIDSILDKDQAVEDLTYIMSKLEERHPACMKGIPEEVKSQYNKEISGLKDQMTVLELWQASARILSRLKDAHTNVGYYTKEISVLPLTFDMEDGELYCSGDDFTNYKVKLINDVPWKNLYQTYLDQFSYELESYAEYNFAKKLLSKVFMDFIGVDTSSNISIIFELGEGEQEETFSFGDQKEGNTVSKEPFVFFEIDKEKSLGILTLLSCDYNKVYKDTLKDFFTEVKANGIHYVAVDLRNNGGGNSSVANEFIRYLDIDEYYETGGMDVRYGPFLSEFKKSITKNKKYEDLLFTGKVYSLTSNKTFSSAQMFANMISDNDIGELIGEIPGNMPASYGDILFFQTPNANLLFTISYKYFGRIDETKADLPLIPDYEVNAENALEKLYEVINKDK